MKNLIFDLGANVGGNIEYYLSKSQKVVAIEANPVLCKIIKEKFSHHIKEGRLILHEACLALEEKEKEVNFYVNKFDSGASTFCVPTFNMNDFYSISVSSISYRELIDKYGNPDFVKLDLEGYDKVVLNYMIENNKLPDYLQFENQGIEMLKKIVDSKVYRSYNIVPFYNFSKIYNFSHERSAGPIELDIKSPWLTSKQLIALYNFLPHSWVDIHMSKENYIRDNKIDFSFYKHKEPLLNKIKLLIPETFKSKIKSLLKISR